MATAIYNGRCFTVIDMKDVLANSTDGLDILECLVHDMTKTEATLNNKLNEDGFNVLFLRVLSQAVSCPIRIEKVILLLTSIRDSVFFKVGLAEMIVLYDLFSEDVAEFCSLARDCVNIITQLSLRLPSVITEVIGLVGILRTKIEESLPDLHDSPHNTNLNNILQDLSSVQESIGKTLTVKDTKVRMKISHVDDKPPDDFRDIPVLPREKDILNSRGFLRANKARGSYNSLNHYLDVQFRLYREDCITPLREGIYEYVSERANGKNVGRLQDGRLYKDVIAIRSDNSIDGLLVTIKIDSKQSSHINWFSSQRLIYGSLVCLSPDHFQSLYFAVVADSCRETLKNKSTFVVIFENGIRAINHILHRTLTMVESTAYYEAYRHVLPSLQNIHDGDLPFEKYLVYCRKDVDPPKYVSNESAMYDFHPVVANELLCKNETERRGFRNRRQQTPVKTQTLTVDIFTPIDLWPTPDELHLDESQFRAFHSALTEEFVLIQGPPGTGKTYVGLQIAKVLLHNKAVWNERITDGDDEICEKSPMLVVCFTNHALDQFLEGIIKFHDSNSHGWRKDIVRAGGRCKSTIVEEFALKKRRYRYRQAVNTAHFYNQMKDFQSRSSRARWCINHCKKLILSPTTLSKIMLQKHAKYFIKRSYTRHQTQPEYQNFDEEAIAKWLGVSETSWTKRARQAYSREIEKYHSGVAMHSEAESTVENHLIDVDNEAKQADDNRRIEEDEIVLEESCDNIGLDVLKLLQRILFKYEEEDIDDIFKQLMQKEAENILKRLKSTERMPYNIASAIDRNLWRIPFEQRWSLYLHWVEVYCNQQHELLNQYKADEAAIYKDYKKELQETDRRIFKESTVIGMTTTGAAKYHDVLREIGPRIIIVEEAAEVLEAHIIATLSPKCEHLILIGDHKQLEPKPSVYELEIKYNLGVSLFERMLNNDLAYHCLQRQHRMRPEISSLVRHIYPNLIDNENVEKYGKINGVSKDVFFLTHNHPEEKRNDTRSYVNRHEAQYIMRLCQYLMLQGYQPTQITVLAAYNGQMFCIRELMPKKDFFGVNVCAVDNYQGEENDIVLLSLTRSNKEGIIGFLKKENRICVALSRAKKGLYVIGDFSLLSKKSSLWGKLTKDMRNAKALGEALPLYCCNHPEKTIMARLPRDFDKAPDGGCTEKCDYRLECGHACRLNCHPKDREHKDYQCKEKCFKTCPFDHKCRKTCHYGTDCFCGVIMDRVLRCQHHMRMKCHENPDEKQCKIKVARKLETCGHEVEMLCFQDPDDFQCYIKVPRTLACAHEINIECHIDPHYYKCRQIVKRKRSCGHQYEVQCHENQEKYEKRYMCKDLVERERSCGHTYTAQCFENQSVYERQHKCKVLVTRRRSCDHAYDIECSVDHESYEKNNKCNKIVSKSFQFCNHTIETKCYLDITKQSCKTIINKTLECGHIVEVKCHKRNAAKCPSQCLKTCENKHVCQKPCHFGTPCNCNTKIEKKLPKCDHTQVMECHRDPLNESCRTKIMKMVPKCEHYLELECGKDINLVLCNVEVEKPLPKCGHQNKMTCHQNPAEFKPCNVMVSKGLKCGHTIDVKCCELEKKVKCIAMVEKQLPCKHLLKMKCSDDVSSVVCRQKTIKTLPECGHSKEMTCSDSNFEGIRCQQQVKIKHQQCGHSDEIKCYQTIKNVRCERNVMITLPCGHKTTVMCYKNPLTFDSTVKQSTARPRFPVCRKKVDKILPCNHVTIIECRSQDDDIKCTLACTYMLACGHFCSGRCSDCSQSGLHVPCSKSCAKKLICGHDCQSQTCGTCKPCQQICPLYCSHMICEHLCNLPCEPCKRPCSWSCTHYKCTKLCHEQCDRPKCNKRCQKMLNCNHQCMGFCGEPCPISCAECLPAKKYFVDENIFNNRGMLVVLPECRHEIPAEQLDELFRYIDICTLNFPLCPLCSAEIRWHPRYGNVLNGIKSRKNQVKRMLASNISETKQQCFPIIHPNFGALQAYLKQCKTFLLTQQTELKDSNDVSNKQCKIVLSLVTRIFQALKNSYFENPREQNLHDLYNQVYYLTGQWILFLALRSFQQIEDISSEQSDEEETENCQGAVGGVTRLKHIKSHHRDTNDFEKTRDILKMPLHFTYVELCQVISMMRPYINDLGQLFVASNCPVFNGMVNVHVEDWEMCKQGHFQPKSGHRGACIMCTTNREPNFDLFLENEMRHGHQSPFKHNPAERNVDHKIQDCMHSSERDEDDRSINARGNKRRSGDRKQRRTDIKEEQFVSSQTQNKTQEQPCLQKSKFQTDDTVKVHTKKSSSQYRHNGNRRFNKHHQTGHQMSEASDQGENIPQTGQNRNKPSVKTEQRRAETTPKLPVKKTKQRSNHQSVHRQNAASSKSQCRRKTQIKENPSKVMKDVMQGNSTENKEQNDALNFKGLVKKQQLYTNDSNIQTSSGNRSTSQQRPKEIEIVHGADAASSKSQSRRKTQTKERQSKVVSGAKQRTSKENERQVTGYNKELTQKQRQRSNDAGKGTKSDTRATASAQEFEKRPLYTAGNISQDDKSSKVTKEEKPSKPKRPILKPADAARADAKPQAQSLGNDENSSENRGNAFEKDTSQTHNKGRPFNRTRRHSYKGYGQRKTWGDNNYS